MKLIVIIWRLYKNNGYICGHDKIKDMKTTSTGYRITKKGTVMMTVEKDAFKSDIYLGKSTKVKGVYYFFNRKQGEKFIYLP